MTPLTGKLLRRIRLTGPITVAEYMAEALGHPEHGYYRRADPLGAGGDFVTAPEISQMLGELIGLWCVDCWQRLGSPDPFILAELGPGRGTLMADALRAARVRPAFLAALRLHLVESSATLRSRQQQALPPLPHPPQWHEDFAAVPEGPLLLVANEFFDALPVHQFERTQAGWRERMIGADEESELRFVLGPPSTAFALLHPFQRDVPAGSIVEVSPAALHLAGRIAERIVSQGGAALIIDYGHDRDARSPEPWVATFRAAKAHRWQDPLRDPGAADLTADVDFAALARAARHARAAVYGTLTQGELLRRLGIEVRAAALRARAAPAGVSAIDAALHRLLAPDEMGRLFKALAIVPGEESPWRFGPPPGFEDAPWD